jgi:hypothetical protein
MPLSGLYTVDDRMINEYGAVGRVRVARDTAVFRENLPQCQFFHHIPYDLN